MRCSTTRKTGKCKAIGGALPHKIDIYFGDNARAFLMLILVLYQFQSENTLRAFS